MQFLLAPNYSKESAVGIFSEFTGTPYTGEFTERFFRFGGRLIGELAGIGTVSVMAKTFQWPIEIINIMDSTTLGGSLATYTTFGGYIDITAIENLGVSLGYTGFLPYSNADGVDNILWHGIDLSAIWTGIEGLSLSTHHNVSFANGSKNEWMGALKANGSSFLTVYNAIGATKTLTEKFSLNGEIANVLSKTDTGVAGKIDYNNFFAGVKLITQITENAAFDASVTVDFSKNFLSGTWGDEDKTMTTFSVPVAVRVSF